MTGHNVPLVAGVELGGTKVIALLARDREIIAKARLPTSDPERTLNAIGDRLNHWARQYGLFAAIGIGSFGPVGVDPARPDFGRITTTPKPGWQHVDIAGYFISRFAVPVAFDTDVIAAACAEYRWGAGQNCEILVYLTVGTGIGAGILVNGQAIHGLIHPEFGHIRVRRSARDDFVGICPFHGDCLEGLASGPAIAARAGQSGARVADADPLFQPVTDALAEAMAILLLTVSPQHILIGGGVLHHRPALFQAIRRKTALLLAGYLDGIDTQSLARIIKPPGLGNLAGPLGAIALAIGKIRTPDP
jgi:fructokinase